MTTENEFTFKILGKISITTNTNKETKIEVSENTTFNDEEIQQIKNTLEAILQLKQTINNENDDKEFQQYEFKRVKTPDYSYPKPELPPTPWYHAPVWYCKDDEKYWDKTTFSK